MGNYSMVREIEARFDALKNMRITDDQSARDALTYAMVTVSHMNQLSTQAEAPPTMRAGLLTDDILKKLKEWIDRLVSALTQIVEKLVGATSFSISVGTNVSVMVNFGPFAGASV